MDDRAQEGDRDAESSAVTGEIIVDKKKLIILILVVIGILTIMMFGAGAYRSKSDRTPGANEESHPIGKALEAATGWLKSEFDTERMVTVCKSGSTLRFSSTCEIMIKPGSGRPSSFKLARSGLVAVCFAFSRAKLAECVSGAAEPKLELMRQDEARFTVAKDTAFIFLRCQNPGGSTCQMSIKND
jgi:hypothetical protein